MTQQEPTNFAIEWLLDALNDEPSLVETMSEAELDNALAILKVDLDQAPLPIAFEQNAGTEKPQDKRDDPRTEVDRLLDWLQECEIDNLEEVELDAALGTLGIDTSAILDVPSDVEIQLEEAELDAVSDIPAAGADRPCLQIKQDHSREHAGWHLKDNNEFMGRGRLFPHVAIITPGQGKYHYGQINTVWPDVVRCFVPEAFHFAGLAHAIAVGEPVVSVSKNEEAFHFAGLAHAINGAAVGEPVLACNNDVVHRAALAQGWLDGGTRLAHAINGAAVGEPVVSVCKNEEAFHLAGLAHAINGAAVGEPVVFVCKNDVAIHRAYKFNVARSAMTRGWLDGGTRLAHAINGAAVGEPVIFVCKNDVAIYRAYKFNVARSAMTRGWLDGGTRLAHATNGAAVGEPVIFVCKNDVAIHRAYKFNVARSAMTRGWLDGGTRLAHAINGAAVGEPVIFVCKKRVAIHRADKFNVARSATSLANEVPKSTEFATFMKGLAEARPRDSRTSLANKLRTLEEVCKGN